MNINMMRSEIGLAYTGNDWQKKVNKMKDKQVIAIYYSLLKHDKFNSKKKKKTSTYEQLKFDI